jgi:Uma2 family endonuclease
MSDITISPPTEHDRYSLHPEVDVVETPPHRRQIEYLETNLRSELPHLFVGGNIGVYWVPGAYEEPWVGPDVLVSQGAPATPPHRVYLVWEHGPIRFVAEVASNRTRRAERRKRETYYRVDLQIPEYLYIDLDRHQLELWRLEEGEYQRVPGVEGRLGSQELDLKFGWDNEQEFVRIWTPDGRMLLTKEEDLELNRALAAERDVILAEREAAREAEVRALARAREVEAEREAARAAEAQALAHASEAEAEREAAREAAAQALARFSEAESEREAARKAEAQALARVREAEARAAELAAELEQMRRLGDAGPAGGPSKEE